MYLRILNLMMLVALCVLLDAGCGGKSGASRSSSTTTTSTDQTQANATGFPTDPAKVTADKAKSFSQADLNAMSLAEVENVLEARTEQNNASQGQLNIMNAINLALCQRLMKVRTDCKVAIPIISDGTDKDLQCDGSSQNSGVNTHTFNVTVAENITGLFYLLVNDTFQSSPFGAGQSAITFSSTADATMEAPQLMSVYEIVLRPTVKGPLPDKASFNFTMNVDGVPVITRPLLDSKDANELGSQYDVDVVELAAMGTSSSCRVTPADVNNIKAQITSTMQAQQALKPQSSKPSQTSAVQSAPSSP